MVIILSIQPIQGKISTTPAMECSYRRRNIFSIRSCSWVRIDYTKTDNKADCHGYTFAKNKLWINSDQVDKILKNDNYDENVKESMVDIVIFKNDGKVVHSAKRNSDGTYNNNAGIAVTEYRKTLKEAARGTTDVSNKKNVDFAKKRTPNRIIDTKFGKVDTDGVRRITDPYQIKISNTNPGHQMIKYLIFVYFLLSSSTLLSQHMFKVIESRRDQLYGGKASVDTGVSYYRIVVNDDTSIVSPTYPIFFPKEIDTLQAIGELLKFEGDTRRCVFPINNYNLLSADIYRGPKKNYSIQVEALFVINQLFYDEPFKYASYPLLIDRKTKQTAAISGTGVSAAFKSYRKWYKKMCRLGINYMKAKHIHPVDGSTVRWY